MTDMEPRPLSDILAKAGQPDPYAPPKIRNLSAEESKSFISQSLRPGSDNIKRIAEFVTKLTWREITTIAQGVSAAYVKSEEPDTRDLGEAFVVWAEKLLGEHV